MRQRCDPSALIQWLSFNRPSPPFQFSISPRCGNCEWTAVLVLFYRLWWSVCDKKKKKEKNFGKTVRDWEYGRGRILTGSSNENLWSVCSHADYARSRVVLATKKFLFPIFVSSSRVSVQPVHNHQKRKGYVISIYTADIRSPLAKPILR